MSRPELIFASDSVRVHGGGLAIDVRIPWYRSLPLSAISEVTVRIDGIPVPTSDLTLRWQGNDYAIQDLAEHWDRIWFIQDTATLLFPFRDSPAPLDISVGMRIRLPYIIIEPYGALERYFEYTRMVTPIQEETQDAP
ncbi:C-glycoside deglycosidase beta subunit domain-containing protein [Arthrobacter sp. SD76]|uniref:C-glycoside deglycosidase beta subunit domain-containing protein n=1 Tax=Arthrobacter sp. SD76 TaxID=3415007 RepID=UPI003C78F05D